MCHHCHLIPNPWPRIAYFKVVNFMVHPFYLYFSKGLICVKKTEDTEMARLAGLRPQHEVRWGECQVQPVPGCSPPSSTPKSLSPFEDTIPPTVPQAQCVRHAWQTLAYHTYLEDKILDTWHSPETSLLQAETVRTLTAGPLDHGRDWPPL